MNNESVEINDEPTASTSGGTSSSSVPNRIVLENRNIQNATTSSADVPPPPAPVEQLIPRPESTPPPPAVVNNNDDVVVLDDSVDLTRNVVVAIRRTDHIENLVAESKLKRKRSKSKTPSPKKKNAAPLILDDEDDDGCTCPICLDSWEMCGPHRLTSLKCGHLFGLSCIKRWINESSSVTRCCPSCKKKAFVRDLRNLYAKKIVVLDNTELEQLRTDLEAERAKYKSLEINFSVTKMNLAMAEQKTRELTERIAVLESSKNNFGLGITPPVQTNRSFKLFLEKNIDMGRDAGCRVLIYHPARSAMVISQKSNQSLFPGFGVRLVDVTTYRPNLFLHVSTNMLRDITIDKDDSLLLTASRERTTKLSSIGDRSVVATLTVPVDTLFWSCCFDKDRNKFVYLGLGNGSAYVYDIRRPSEFLKEFKTEYDFSPVINICSVPACEDIPFGGFVMCKLKSIWFFEYTATQDVAEFQLNIEGTFISASYEDKSKMLLVTTRPSAIHPHVRYIIGSLEKYDNNMVYLKVTTIINGSVGMQMMIKSALVNIDNEQLYLAGYLEDQKYLALWKTSTSQKTQTISVNKTIYDIVPFSISGNHYLSGITENDFKIYKFNES